MNPITSSAFREGNQILFQTRILHDNWESRYYGKPEIIAENDIIDLNRDNKVRTSWESTGFTSFNQRFTEPCLVNSMEQLTDSAKKYGTEVITQEDVSDLKIEDGGYSTKIHGFMHENQRSISTLVNKLAPLEKDAKWAIDLTSKEFLIYQQK